MTSSASVDNTSTATSCTTGPVDGRSVMYFSTSSFSSAASGWRNRPTFSAISVGWDHHTCKASALWRLHSNRPRPFFASSPSFWASSGAFSADRREPSEVLPSSRLDMFVFRPFMPIFSSVVASNVWAASTSVTFTDRASCAIFFT